MKCLHSTRHCSSSHNAGPSRSRPFLYLCLAATLLLLSYHIILVRFPDLGADRPMVESIIADGSNASSPSTPNPVPPIKTELVFAAMKEGNMSWVQEHLPDWQVNIYRADGKRNDMDLTVPVNKGNEAMVYLTYLIDRYWSLPDIAIFLHGDRYQWHVDNPLYDSVISISHLNLDFVQEVGYVNLRCAWSVGCPSELEPARYLRERPDDHVHPTAVEYPDRFMELFPRTEVPEVVGTPCCSQFALSKGKIWERRLEDYIRLRRWLMETELEAGISGRIMEYSWHMIFGKPAQYCIDQRECYCRTYGYCNMTDEDIQKQWVWRGLQLPKDWPEQKETQ
ncbi:hypothetical protein N7535_002475 [Penicillium sp. DV-2018c]|nr:hypothetical protein N7535_002475 [Penicillium sp. DV-2018c]